MKLPSSKANFAKSIDKAYGPYGFKARWNDNTPGNNTIDIVGPNGKKLEGIKYNRSKKKNEDEAMTIHQWITKALAEHLDIMNVDWNSLK